MPITINLLEEEQTQAIAHLYDPLQIVLRVGITVVAVLVAAVGVAYFYKYRTLKELDKERIEWISLEKEAKRLEALKNQREAVHGRLLAYAKYSSGRLLQASLLETLRTLLPNDVYLTEITASTRFDRVQKTVPKPGGGTQSLGEVDAEVRDLVIRGKARGEKYYEVINDFLNTLRNDPQLSKLVLKPQTDIFLEGEMRVTEGETVSKTGMREAEFMVRCRLMPQYFQ